MACAYYSTKGILPGDFLKLPRLEKLFMIVAFEKAVELENKKFEALAKLLGAKRK